MLPSAWPPALHSFATALLPFEFQCGFVGYFAHDLKRECGFPTRWPARTRDAAFAFADRLVVYDHETNDLYLLSLSAKGDGMKGSTTWFEEVRANLKVPSALPLAPALRVSDTVPVPLATQLDTSELAAAVHNTGGD